MKPNSHKFHLNLSEKGGYLGKAGMKVRTLEKKPSEKKKGKGSSGRRFL
jgi:hypothetical protein